MRLNVARWTITNAAILALALGGVLVGAGVTPDSRAYGLCDEVRSGGTQEDQVPTLPEFLFLLEPERDNYFETGATDSEQVRFAEHFEYLKRLLSEGTLRFAGRCTDGAPGIVVLRAKDLDEAKKLLDGDPAVAAGVMYGSVRPFRTVLVEGRDDPRIVADASNRVIRVEATVVASLKNAWSAWTTDEGVSRWFADETNIELRVGGPYEIYFGSPELAPDRGSEGCQVLSFLPMEMLSFEWNAPTKFGELRERHTRVVVLFDKVDAGRVRVRLAHLGFGKGERWDRVYTYFTAAWPRVMDSFRQHFAGSPGDRIGASREQPPSAESAESHGELHD